MVTGIEASEDETALFISGAFSQVNGITRYGIAKYDLVNNRIDPTFAPTGMRTVSDIKLANGALIAAGNFDKHVMAMNPTTGEDLDSINITVAGVVDPTDETRVQRIAISPDGTRLVATGNFATVNGQSRKRAFMLNLGSTVLSTWHAPRFDVNCAASSRLVSAQGVDFSPDGSFFVIVATGGPTGTNGICDAAARFETANVSSTVQPTWINWTGGDTLWSVAVTGAAVYVGGHQRWLDNPYGYDSAGAGAVSRPGIGAIDPLTGKALPWNPTKSRNDGTRALLATPDGLWVGSDGERFGGEDHAGIGFAPLELSPTSDTTRPDTFIDSGPSGTVSDTSATFSFSASEPSTSQCRLDGAAFAPCMSPLSYKNLSEGSHTYQVVAVDGSYNMDASPAAQSWTVAAPGSELIGNPGFEVNTSGWSGVVSSNTLTRVSGGHSGGWAVEASNTVAGVNCGLDDSPNWVSYTEEGSYTASIWARSDTLGVTLKLRVREYLGGAMLGTVTETLALTSSRQQVTANYTPVAPGSSLDVQAYASNAPAGVCFQADDASITFTPNNDPPPVAVDDSATTGEDAAVIINVAANDSDPDGNLNPNSANSICVNDGSSGCNGAANGSLTDNGDGTITYTPYLGFTGSDSFVYEICDMLDACDTASVTITVSEQPIIYVSSTGSGSAGGISFRDEDILAYDISTQTWSMYFDGSDVGLGASGQDIDAFHINTEDGSILLSLSNAGTIPDVGNVHNFDIVRFIPTSTGSDTVGRYELYFDGEDVELTTSGENIDAIGFAPDGRLVISTSGSFSVGVVGEISGKDEDLLIFTDTSLGETTSGSWGLYFDGSDVGLSDISSEDINGTWIDDNGDIYLTTSGAFSVAGAAGDGADIFTCVPVTLGGCPRIAIKIKLLIFLTAQFS